MRHAVDSRSRRPHDRSYKNACAVRGLTRTAAAKDVHGDRNTGRYGVVKAPARIRPGLASIGAHCANPLNCIDHSPNRRFCDHPVKAPVGFGTWATFKQVIHKVIHRLCGQRSGAERREPGRSSASRSTRRCGGCSTTARRPTSTRLAATGPACLGAVRPPQDGRRHRRASRRSDMPEARLKSALARDRRRTRARPAAARTAALVRRVLPAPARGGRRRGPAGRAAQRHRRRGHGRALGTQCGGACGNDRRRSGRARTSCANSRPGSSITNLRALPNWPRSPHAGASTCANSKGAAGSRARARPLAPHRASRSRRDPAGTRC